MVGRADGCAEPHHGILKSISGHNQRDMHGDASQPAVPSVEKEHERWWTVLVCVGKKPPEKKFVATLESVPEKCESE
jgi:hypothetical protein